MDQTAFIVLEVTVQVILTILFVMLYHLGHITKGGLLGLVLQLTLVFVQANIYLRGMAGLLPRYIAYGVCLPIWVFMFVHLWVLYHWSLCKLSCYPGPMLWSISRLPQTYYLFRGTLPWKIHELHKKYGPVVRVAPNELSYTNFETWNDIYAKGDDRSQLRKDPGFTPSAANKTRSIKFELEDDEHARLRRNLSHGFSNANIRAQEPIIIKYTHQLIDLIKSKNNAPVDVTEMFNFLLFDIAGDMVFGDSFNCLNSDALHPWIKFIFARISGSALISEAAKYWPFSFLFKFFIPRFLIDGDFKHATLAKEHLDQRLARNQARPDFTTYLQTCLNKPGGLSYGDLVETTRTLIVGGAETTATLLTGLTFYLLNPHRSSYSRSPRETLNALTSILRQTFNSASEITVAALQTEDLAYLKACVNEGLRLFPPLPGNLRRIVPRGGKVIAGKWVPGGTRVAVDILSANLSAENFAFPEGFYPERWFHEFREPGKIFERDICQVVKPFSHGPRNCIGKNLALMEMQLILAHLLWHFDIELEEESKDWISRVRCIGFFVKPKLMVRFSLVMPTFGSEEEIRDLAGERNRLHGHAERATVLEWLSYSARSSLSLPDN